MVFGVDGLAIGFIILTTILFPYCIISSWDLKHGNRCLAILIYIEVLLILTFLSIDIFWFYFFFEMTLFPIIYIIMKWGQNERRQLASIYFYTYAVVGSLAMLIALAIIYTEIGTTSFLHYYKLVLPPRNNNIFYLSFEKQKIIWVLLFISFSTKIPVLPFTIWLPEAHVEAPTAGSIVLAALLLKVGGYGIIKFLLVFPIKTYYQPFVLAIFILTAFYAGVAATAQADIKRFIAYLSILHINIALIGVYTLTKIGGIGGATIIFSHGIISAGLFYLVGVLYVRFSTRLFEYYNNIITFIPIFTVYFILFILSNISFPITSGFIGEILIIAGIVKKKIWLSIIIFGIIILLNTYCSLISVQHIIYGSFISSIDVAYKDLNRIEIIVLTHLMFINVGFALFPRGLISLFSPFFTVIYSDYNNPAANFYQ